MKIREASDQYLVQQFGGYRAFIKRECLGRWQVPAVWDVDKTAAPLKAFVVASDWVVRCECGEQFVVQSGEPYFCPNCLNVAQAHGKARRVAFPANRRKIEATLLLRPFPQNRNWLLAGHVNPDSGGRLRDDQTVADLQVENSVHHIEVNP